MSDITEFVKVWEAKEEAARRTSEYWKAEHTSANAEIESLRQQLAEARDELSQLREVVGVRGDVKTFASDRDYWCRLMDKADRVDRLERQLAAERENVARYILLQGELRDQITRLSEQLAAERQKRCGTCEFWESDSPDAARCFNPASECNWDLVGGTYSASHGCPHWRGKEAK